MQCPDRVKPRIPPGVDVSVGQGQSAGSIFIHQSGLGNKYVFNVGESYVLPYPKGILASIKVSWLHRSLDRKGTTNDAWSIVPNSLENIGPSAIKAEFTRSKDDVSDARFPIRETQDKRHGCAIVADCWWREPFWEIDLGEQWSFDSKENLERTIVAITVEDCESNYLEDPSPMFPVHILLFPGSVRDRVRRSTSIFEAQGATPLPPRLDDAMRLASYSVRFSLGRFMQGSGDHKGTFTWNLAARSLGKGVRYIRIQARGPKYFKLGRVKIMSTPPRSRDGSRCGKERIVYPTSGSSGAVTRTEQGPICFEL